MPEAITLECDMCKKQPIPAGYRCLTCNIDICDSCTTKDCRNAFMLWPRREFHKIVQHLEHFQKESSLAKDYLQKLQSLKDKSYLKACPSYVDQEMKGLVQEKKAKSFGLTTREMY